MRIALLLLVLAQVVHGQISSGSISGRITDESGAVMSGVAVTATQESTGFSRSTATDHDGSYTIAGLAPGVYSIRAEQQGFRTGVASAVVVEVNQHARLDLTLRVGEAREMVAITERVSAADTESSAISYRLDSRTSTALPLDERRVGSLVTLGPGAIPRHLGGFGHDSYNDVQQGSRGSVALNPPINGARSTMNGAVLDGAYNTDPNTFATVVSPPMEAVQEFRIQSSMAPVAFAQSGGGTVDVVTKSGGLAFHGSAFEYLRNEATDARNYFDDPSLPRSMFRRNQFGGSLGGPMPWRRWFFFTAYEGLRGKSATPKVQLVPTPEQRAGDFRGRNVIYDPTNLTPAGDRIPFTGNVIPSHRIDPIAARFLAEYEPLPNRPGSPNRNYLNTTPNTADHDLVSGRIDHQLRDSSLLFARYTINDERGGAGQFPLRPTSEKLRAQQAVVGYTRGGASWNNELRASFTRLRLFNIPLSAFQSDVARELGILNPPDDPFTFGLPFFFLANFSTVTDDPTLPQVQRDNNWGISETFSLVRGRSTLRAGFQWMNFQLNYRQSRNVRGRYTYSGAYTGPGGPNLGMGDALADFLLGFPQMTERTVGNSQAYMRQRGYSFFLQHDWRASSSLTLTAGLRYDYFSPFTEIRSSMLNLDYSALPQPPSLVNVERAHDPNRLNFSPRVGVAWRLPWLSTPRGNTVFRAGYGIYYTPEIALESYSLVLNGIRNELNTTTGLGQPVLTTRDGFPSTPGTGLPSYYGLDSKLATPYVQQWNAGIQRELPGSVLFEAAYVGGKGVHLGRARRFNTALHTETGENLGPRPGNLQANRTFPSLGPIFQFQHIANSNYHSMQLKSEKRFQNSLTFLASFVWSKSIDDASSVVPALFNSGGAQDERDLSRERALSSFHVGRRVSAGFVYALPVPNTWLAPLRGWQVSGVVTLQDGKPHDPLYVSTNTANAGTFTRPDIVAGQKVELPRSQRTPERWFNTAAFTAPPLFQFGNAGRNIIIGPGSHLIDLALHKRFRLSEGATLEFRAESFNLFNRPNLDYPDPYPDQGPFFGRTLLSGQPRRLQFAARIDF